MTNNKLKERMVSTDLMGLHNILHQMVMEGRIDNTEKDRILSKAGLTKQSTNRYIGEDKAIYDFNNVDTKYRKIRR